MNPALLGALITNIAVPELTAWLASLHASGETVDDAAILQKLLTDTTIGIQIGEAFLAAHRPTV